MRGLGHIYKRGNIWWIKYHINGEPRYESSESSVKQVAIDLLKKKFTSPGPRASGKVTVGDLLDDLLSYYKSHNPKSHDSMAVPCVKHLREFFGTWKAVKVGTVGINHYKEQRTDEEASAGTINRELALLRRAYKLALESTPPKVGSVPRFELLPEANPRQGFLELAQYEKLRDALPDDIRPIFIVGYHVGSRKSEILNLRKVQIDWPARKIRLNVGETKNKSGRYLPIYGDMVDAIDGLRNQPGEFLFYRANGDRIVDLRPAWENACKAAGVPGLLFHDLRRSAVRNMIRAGIPEQLAMKISGHKTATVFRRYNIIDERDIDQAAERMAAFMGGGK